MKTIKLIVIAIFSFAILNSCVRKDNPEQWYTEVLEVKSGDWRLVNGPIDRIGSYYEYIFDDFPYVDGIVTVYLYQGFGTNSEMQYPLPYTDYGVEVLSDGSRIPYSIQYSYDIARDGTIALKVHVSDYYTSSFIPGTEHFRVAIIY